MLFISTSRARCMEILAVAFIYCARVQSWLSPSFLAELTQMRPPNAAGSLSEDRFTHATEAIRIRMDNPPIFGRQTDCVELDKNVYPLCALTTLY